MMKSFSFSPFIAEPEGPLDTMSVVAEFPVRGLRTEAFGFLMSKWWDATTAGRACFLGKSFDHVGLSLIKLFARTVRITFWPDGKSFNCPSVLSETLL